jgi:hypothetical protein
MIVMMVGIGIINAASAIEESGLARRYQSTGGANIHDSYYTVEMFGFIPITGTPDYRIGWLMIIAALLIHGYVAIWFLRSRSANRSRIDT